MRPLHSLLVHLTANRVGQSVLHKTVSVAQHLQGIGLGGNVASSGETALFSKLRRFAKPGRPMRIFDVGANKGQFFLLACQCLKGEAFHIDSFEPSKETFYQLFENTREYQEISTLNNCGLGRSKSELNLFYDSAGSGLASLTRRELAHIGIEMSLTEKVQIITLDDYCRDHQVEHIDLLKIDVEGHELDVLYGSEVMFRKSSISMVMFEFGGTDVDTRTFFRDFFKFFKDHNMQIARITPSGYLFELSSYQEAFEQFVTTNFLATAHNLK